MPAQVAIGSMSKRGRGGGHGYPQQRGAGSHGYAHGWTTKPNADDRMVMGGYPDSRGPWLVCKPARYRNSYKGQEDPIIGCYITDGAS